MTRETNYGKGALAVLVTSGTLAGKQAKELAAAVRTGTVVVAGATGSGKTTLLAALLDTLEDTPIELVEELYELLETHARLSAGSGEPRGLDVLAPSTGSTLNPLADACLAVGEVRDGQAATRVALASSAGRSCLTTIHDQSGNPEKVLLKMELMARASGASRRPFRRALGEVTVAFVARGDDGTCRVANIARTRLGNVEDE